MNNTQIIRQIIIIVCITLVIGICMIPLESSMFITQARDDPLVFDTIQEEMNYYNRELLKRERDARATESEPLRPAKRLLMQQELPYTTQAGQDVYRKRRGYDYVMKAFEDQEEVEVLFMLKLNPEYERLPELSENEYEQQRTQHILEIRKQLAETVGMDPDWFLDETDADLSFRLDKETAKNSTIVPSSSLYI